VQPYFRQNVCANYYGGAPKPSTYDFKIGQPFPTNPNSQNLTELMQTGQFDALLVSDQTLSRQESEAVARLENYFLVRSFDGDTIWKDHFLGPDDLSVFEKSATFSPGTLANPK
jgi:hypothetical protein